MTKKRLDLAIHEKYPQLSRSYIQQAIKSGGVLVDGTVTTRPGVAVESTATVKLLATTPKFVSRGGFKLEAALNHFKLDIAGLVALDCGLSTGGFTDCLLQRGIKKVYGIDVGTAQVHPSIAADSRVVVYENTDLRKITTFPELIDLATLDLSFISLTKVISSLIPLLKPTGFVIALIKPQFEAERSDIHRGGLVVDSAIHERAKTAVSNAFADFGFSCVGIISAPLQQGSASNQEFLGLYQRSAH